MPVPEYNKDMYKPKHEKVNPKTKVGELANEFRIKQLKKFKQLSNRDLVRKSGGLAKNTPIFVPTNIKGPVNGYEDQNSNKTFLITSIYIGIFIIFALSSFSWFTESLKFPVVLAIVTELLIGIFVYIFIFSKFILNTDNKRINEARNRGNKAINMAGVWNINPGGIVQEGPNTKVSYHGKEAIVLKLLKKSVLISDSKQDWNHYNAIETAEALILKNGFQFSKFNVKYNTNNDYIWDNLDENLSNSSIVLGKKYSDIMTEFNTYLRKTTESNSKITVVYYIIKPNLINTKISLEELSKQIIHLVKISRCTVSPVTTQEYLRLIKEYYGLRYLDVEEIVDHLAAFDVVPVNVNLLRYINNDGELVSLKEEFKPDIKNFYKVTENTNIKLQDPDRNPAINISQYSVYDDKLIEQN